VTALSAKPELTLLADGDRLSSCLMSVTTARKQQIMESPSTAL